MKQNLFKRIGRNVYLLFAVIFVISAASNIQTPQKTQAQTPTSGTPICGQSVLNSPYNSGNEPTLGSTTSVVVIATGTDTGSYDTANTTYYFAPGTHNMGSDEIMPGSGDYFVGQYSGGVGATLNGENTSDYAFESGGTDIANIVIEYLTVEDYSPPNNSGAISGTYSQGWDVNYDTIQDNIPGTGVYTSTDGELEYDCITANGQQGFGTYGAAPAPISSLTNGEQDLTVTNNEISYNDTCNFEADSNFPITPPSGCAGQGENSDCGCTGGGKFWQTDQSVFENNYVHDNYSVGVWYDTNNTGSTIENNYISGNYGEGLMYEISYNALVQDNTFVNNAWGDGPTNGGFPTGAIYISESGGTVLPGDGNYNGSLDIQDNVFTNNWSGVVLWMDGGRYCGNVNTSSSGTCVLNNSSLYYYNGTDSAGGCGEYNLVTDTPAYKTDTGSPSEDYWDNCHWITQNVTVQNNTFNFDAADITGGYDTVACNGATNGCGMNSTFAGYDSSPFGVYGEFWETCVSTISDCHDVFQENTYNQSGSIPWTFLWHDLSNNGSSPAYDTFSQWQGEGQDVGSSLNTGTDPTVDISDLASNQELYGASASVDAIATANNGGSISSCSLLVNGSTVGSPVTSSPYNFTLNTLSYSDGTYTIGVKATDNQSDIGTNLVSVYISNGDLNSDGSVNISDLAIMAAHWGDTDSNYADGNITGQSTINISDLAVLAANWGWSEA